MTENSGEFIAMPVGAPGAAHETTQSQESVSRGATYKVRFSKFWTSGSRPQNSFDLARRGEIAFFGDRFVVRAFRREMGFMGSRIELTFERAHVADVSQSGDCLSFSIAPPNREIQSIKLWTEDEDVASKLAAEFPKTMTPSAIAVKEYQAQLASVGRADLVTKALVTANVLVFVAAAIGGAGIVVPNPTVLQAWGTNFGPFTTNGQWWRLVSSIFLHFGLFHLALNMWALYVGGRLAERLFGSAAFALIYFAAGIAGSLSSLLWNPAVNSAGASGAIFGVYGAMLAFFLRKDSSIPPSIVRQQRSSGIAFIAFNLINGFSHAGIDNAAHIGGLTIGLVMGLLLARPLEPEARARINAASFYARGSAIALATIGTLFVLVHFSPAGNAAEQAFRRDILGMGELEKHAQGFAKDAFDKLQSKEIGPIEFAERIEKDVLPQWTIIQRTFQGDRVPDNSNLKPLWELLADYSDTRLAAFRLFDSGARTGRSTDFKQAQDKLELGQIDLKLIKDLDQKNK
jgi:rhomboid protease GluP